MSDIKRESGSVVPTIIEQSAWDAAMLVDTEVDSLLREHGLTRLPGRGKMMEAIARIVQHAINRSHDKPI